REGLRVDQRRREDLAPAGLMPPRGIVVVGASLGGLEALSVVLGGLPQRYGLPVAVGRHRPAGGGGGGGLRRETRARPRTGQDVVQEPAGAVSGPMPLAAMAAMEADRVLPLDEVARYLEIVAAMAPGR